MEFSQAFILTNALGGLSSVGRTLEGEGRPSLSRLQVDGYQIDLRFVANMVLLEVSHPSVSPSFLPRPLVAQELDALLPGRVIAADRIRSRSMPLFPTGRGLAAVLDDMGGPLHLSVELTIDGHSCRSSSVKL